MSGSFKYSFLQKIENDCTFLDVFITTQTALDTYVVDETFCRDLLEKVRKGKKRWNELFKRRVPEAVKVNVYGYSHCANFLYRYYWVTLTVSLKFDRKLGIEEPKEILKFLEDQLSVYRTRIV